MCEPLDLPTAQVGTLPAGARHSWTIDPADPALEVAEYPPGLTPPLTAGPDGTLVLERTVPLMPEGGTVLVAGGTPGRPNSRLCETVDLVAPGSVWRFWRGREEPPGGLGRWIRNDYDASAWEIGESVFGYGVAEHFTTHLADMRDSYATLFLRTTFVLGSPDAFDDYSLVVNANDGFVAYLNGEEIARLNMDDLGVPGRTSADKLIGGVGHVSTGVADHDFFYPDQVGEERVQTPETAASQRCNFPGV